MKEFALIFRIDGGAAAGAADISPAEMQERMTYWNNWMGSIAARDRLSSSGHRLGIKESKTIASGNVVTDGPYTEVKEFINGFIPLSWSLFQSIQGFLKPIDILRMS